MKKFRALLLVICLVPMLMLQNGVYAGQTAGSSDVKDKKIIAVSSCLNNTAVIASDGTVWAWGDNSFGQLGAGESLRFSSKPLRIRDFDNATAIAVGNGYILALKNDGTIWGIGNNTFGQIIDVKASDKVLTATRVPKYFNIKAISAGFNYAMALDDQGKVIILGSYSDKGGTQMKRAPERVSSFSNAVKVLLLRYNAAALKDDGTLWAFRGNQLKPVEINNIDNIAAISEGLKKTFAADSEGNVWHWGINGQGALKLNGVSDIIELCDAGGLNTLALDKYGTLWTWNNEAPAPRKVYGIGEVSSISAGDRHMAVITRDGTLWTWGDNDLGQLGIGAEGYENNPVTVLGINDVKEIAASKNYTLALKNDGTVWAWGDNSHGQLGSGNKLGAIVPQKVEGLEGITAISAGASHAAAVKNDGTLWTWGSNESGELGDGTYINRLRPVQVKDIDKVTAVSASESFTVALRSNRTLWAWGNSGYTRNNDPADLNRSVPRRIQELDNIRSFDTGRDFVLALKNNGSVWGWGSNNYGQLGSNSNGKFESIDVPRAISGMISIKKVSAGTSCAIALRSDEKLYLWGDNSYGKTIYTRYLVKGIDAAADISCGERHYIVTKKDGSIWGWGDNSYGQLGDSGSGIVEHPVRIEGLQAVRNIYTGYNHTIAVMEDGTVKAWGDNRFGQLGNGKKGIIKSDVPIQINNFK